MKTKFGTFTEILYDGRKESIALVMGEVAGKENVLCRIHSHCISAHVFNSIECTCREDLEASQRLIEKARCGVVVWLDLEGKGNGHLALILGMPYKEAGFSPDARSYRAAAEILTDLDVRSIILLADSAGKADDLRAHSIAVSDIMPPVKNS